MSEQQPQGRVRRGSLRRRLDPTLVLAIVLPVVAAVALLLTRPDAWTEGDQSPVDAPLHSQTLICPGAMRGDDGAGVTTLAAGSGGAGGSAGRVTVGGGSGSTVESTPGRVSDVPVTDGSVVLSASGADASGLVAGRGSSRPLSATDCAPPVADEWFTGLGAGPAHNSTIELTNPNDGSAVVDVEVFGHDGPADVPQLRGIAVPGHASRSFDLNKIVARLDALAIHTTVVRGQAAVAVRDRSGQLIGKSGAEEWMPPQAAPALRTLLLGLPLEGESHTLMVANGGDDQVTATVKLITPDSVLTPAQAPQVTLPPGTVQSVDLHKLLGSKVADDAFGLEVDAGGPVTASLRSVVGGDLAVTAPGASVSQPTALVLPAGPGVRSARVAIAGATHVGAVTLVSRNAHGRQLASKRVAVKPQQGAYVDLPAGTALVELRPERTAVAASVVLSGRGEAVVPFRTLVTRAEMPAVAPGLR